MKRLKKVLCVLCVASCLLSLLSGCSKEPTREDEPLQYVAEDDFGKQLKEQDAFTEVARSDNQALFVKGTTAEVMVQDLKTGAVWYTNPQDRGTDTSAQTKQLGSQLDIWIYDENQILSNKNTVSDSLDYGQVTYAQIENGIRVTYVLGKRPTIFVIPTAITVERFENEILAKLDEDSQKYITSRYKLVDINEIDSDSLRKEQLEKYPILAERPLYIINDNLAEFVKEKLQDCFGQAGYSLADLERDNLENGIEQQDLPLIVTIPLEYTLEKDSLVVTVNTAAMELSEEAHISQLSLLRYFGAAGTSDEGYMLLPDGSGSLIRLNNGKSHLPTLKVPVYGEDLTKSFAQQPANELTAALPVYGIKQGDQAFLAIIESGDAIASLEAGVAGQINNYNFIYSSYELTQQITLASAYEGENEMLLFQRQAFNKPLQLRYFFLTEENADYVGMAQRYQEYLVDTGKLQAAEDRSPSLHLELLGSTTYADTFLGIPVEKEQTLTTYEQAQLIVDALHEVGVGKVSVSYLYWANGGSNTTRMNRLKPQKSLGGKNGLSQLQASLTEAGDRLYVTADLQYVVDDTWFDGYMGLFDAPKTILGEQTGKKKYSPITLEEEGYWDTLAPGDYVQMAQSIMKSLSALGLDSVNPLALGQDLYSDFDRNDFVDRQDAVELVKQALAVFSDGGKELMVGFPNAYGLTGADEVMALPADSNEFYLCDESVPFYQIVLHGLIPYSGEAVNHTGDVEQSLLQAAETGSSLLFSLMYETNDVLYETELQINASYYEAWLEAAGMCWQSLEGLLERVSESEIIDHQILSDTLRKTVYDNGISVYVNYGHEDITIEGVAVEARSFTVTGVEE